ncbi:MAG TPA: hypothetical protein VG992_00165 [Candidatus Saccharimonadales bacterium]|nr:hypothetical protein [Candidatus Saccharimonadales bacterium]
MSKQLLAVLVMLVLVIGTLVYLSQRGNVADHTVTATVTNVTNKPNQAEDGYYGITAQDSSGHVHTIDATGYLNTPFTPDEQGQACVDVPKVRVGDTISFNLPAQGDPADDDYVICYPKAQSGYYFRVN